MGEILPMANFLLSIICFQSLIAVLNVLKEDDAQTMVTFLSVKSTFFQQPYSFILPSFKCNEFI